MVSTQWLQAHTETPPCPHASCVQAEEMGSLRKPSPAHLLTAPVCFYSNPAASHPGTGLNESWVPYTHPHYTHGIEELQLPAASQVHPTALDTHQSLQEALYIQGPGITLNQLRLSAAGR